MVSAALEEDLSGGDLTTEACIDASSQATARALARQELVVCGFQVFQETFRQLDAALHVHSLLGEGKKAAPGAVLWEVTGSARAILMAERTALNFVQRMCGTATASREYSAAVPDGSSCRITDTRKTTPGLRALERYAVRTGGAFNHRDQLGSAVLIKDNHIAAAGGLTQAVKRAKQRAPHTCKIEVEVETLDGLDEALAAGADIIMVDNFQTQDVATAVSRAQGRALIEASGGITLKRIAELARAGVDIISVGALTHSARAADISLEIVPA